MLWPVARFLLIEVFSSNHMSVAEWPDTYGIHHWQIVQNSYRKLTWGWAWTDDHWILLRRSNQLSYQVMSPYRTQNHLCTATPISSTNWAIRWWVHIALRTTFVQLIQLHHLFSVTFHFGYVPSLVTGIISIEVFCK